MSQKCTKVIFKALSNNVKCKFSDSHINYQHHVPLYKLGQMESEYTPLFTGNAITFTALNQFDYHLCLGAQQTLTYLKLNCQAVTTMQTFIILPYLI